MTPCRPPLQESACRLLLAPASLLLLLAVPAGAQVNTDSLRNAQRQLVEANRALVASRAAIFLDVQRPESERLAATEEIVTFLEADHSRSAAQIAFAVAESPAIRIRALRLGSNAIHGDSALGLQLLMTVEDAQAPAPLRRAGVAVIGEMTWAAESKRGMFPAMMRALRSAARSSDEQLRTESLGILSLYNDPETSQLLLRSLSDRSTGIPSALAVRLLGAVDPAPHFDALSQILRQPPDEATRLEAVRLLGGHSGSRPVIVGILRDSSASLPLREAALGTLAANDRTRLHEHVLPVVQSENAPAGLRVNAIRHIELMRTSRDSKVLLARRADAFDASMQRLASRSQSPAVRAAAAQYLARTRSPR